MTTGYSGTPLIKKLGFKAGMRVWLDAAMPAPIKAEIDPEANGVSVLSSPVQGIDAAHIFVIERAQLTDAIATIRPLLASNGFLWVSWPKKASNVATDVTEGVIRDCALPTGFVDVKVCAVDTTWSGLKLMIRRELR